MFASIFFQERDAKRRMSLDRDVSTNMNESKLQEPVPMSPKIGPKIGRRVKPQEDNSVKNQ
jgi:hypothetical protein